jgi:hypothetical protein
MKRRSESLSCAASWGLVIGALPVGACAMALFGSWALYFSFQTDPRSIPWGLVWLAVALAVPAAAELSRRRGMRRGQRREALALLVSVTTICATGCAFALVFVLYAAGAYFGF